MDLSMNLPGCTIWAITGTALLGGIIFAFAVLHVGDFVLNVPLSHVSVLVTNFLASLLNPFDNSDFMTAI